MLERQHQQRVGKDPDYDRRHAIQQVRGVAHHERNFRAAEFREIDPAEKSYRNANQRSKQEQLGAAYDRIGHAAAGLAHLSRQFGEEIPVNRISTVVDEISKNKKQNRNGYQRADTGHCEHKTAHQLPPSQARVHACPMPLPRCVVSNISRRARPFRMNVSRNSTRPSSISALRCMSPVASVNSLAMTAAIEYPGEKSELLMVGVLPMTMVTAMVSPSARASARKIEPIMPVFANGTTTFHVDSQRVEPSANAASR